MITTSAVVMFGMMYLNILALDHVVISQTRTWMAVIIGATMAIIMIGFMWGMYPKCGAHIGIVLAGILALAGLPWLMRSQETVLDVCHLRAMTPHHAI